MISVVFHLGSSRLTSQPTSSVIGSQADIDRAKHLGVDSMSIDDLKKLNKNKKLVKKLAQKYDAFIASEGIIRQIPRILGPGLSRGMLYPPYIIYPGRR